jgi:ParB/RepB/Spo0J family partition protein
MVIRNLPVGKIKPDPNQPRKTIDQEKVKNMAQSIITEGIINPIEVDKSYTIITGEMRWRAAKLAGLKTIPCRVITVDDHERFRRQVIENVHNLTMSPWDTAIALKQLLPSPAAGDKHSWNDTGISSLAKEIGMSDRTARGYLGLLEASEPLQKAVKQGKLQYSAVSTIQEAPVAFREKLEQKVLTGKYYRDDVRQIVRALKANPEKADEILEAKTLNKVRELSPQRSDLLAQSFNKVEEFSRRVDLLVSWLKENPPEQVGNIHGMEIVLGFKVLLDAINSWQKPTLKG